MLRFLNILCLVAASNLCFSQGTVKVNVSEVLDQKGGELSAGIFDDPDKFPDIGMGMITKELRVSGSTMTVVYESIDPGNYAVAIFQDIDVNKDLKSNWVGFPREPLGFSNNIKVKFSPPKFVDCMFEVKDGELTELSVTLIDY